MPNNAEFDAASLEVRGTTERFLGMDSDSRLSRLSWVRPQRNPKAAIQRWYMYKCDNKRYSPSRNRITRNRESV